MSVKSIKKSLKRRFKRLKFKYWGLITPEHLTRCIYQRRLNKRLDLDNPKDLNEKIQWLKLRTNTSDWSILSDKYRVREFVKEQGCEDNLVKLYGRWCRAEDIDFENLPDSFVLKTNHGCGGIILVEDKSQLDIKSSRRNLNKWISRPYGLNHAEFHYKKIKRCIIAEELLPNSNTLDSTSIIDYKIWCFNGKPKYILVITNRDTNMEMLTYNLDWERQEGAMNYTARYKEGSPIPRPDSLAEMLNIAEKLANPFPVVRVDLYIANNRVYFGEMTFTSACGMMNYYTDDFLLHMGSMVDLEYKFTENKKNIV